MNTLIALCAILGGALAAPSGGYYVSAPVQPVYVQQPQQETQVLVKKPIVTGTLYLAQDTYGQYKYGYTSSDGQAKDESRTVDGVVDGKFSYTSPEGQYIVLSYQADQGGFRAVGDHLPVVPELPAELAAAYQEANDRLAKAYEEARLRAPVEEEKGGEGGSDEGKGKEESQGQDGGYGDGTRAHQAPPAPAYPQVQHQQQTPIFQVAVAPGAHAHQQPAAPVYQIHAQQPVYQYLKPVVQVAYPSQSYYPVAAVAPAQAPKEEEKKEEKKEEEKSEEGGEGGEEEEKSNEPVPYLQSSYSTEIGGAPAVSAPAPSAPSNNYAHQQGHY